jgi:hypothetical protein
MGWIIAIVAGFYLLNQSGGLAPLKSASAPSVSIPSKPPIPPPGGMIASYQAQGNLWVAFSQGGPGGMISSASLGPGDTAWKFNIPVATGVY